MKVRAKNKNFDWSLLVNCGRFYNREIATLTISEMRELQGLVDHSWSHCLGVTDEMILVDEYISLKSDVNRNLQQRGGF